MVDSQYIINMTEIIDSSDPPRIIIFCHLIPVKERIAPQLSCGRKAIRRTTGNFLRHEILIQLKKFRMRPDIHAVLRNINRQITDKINAFVIDILLQTLPLTEEEILQHFPESNLFSHCFAYFINGRMIASFQFILPLPP